MDVSSIGKMDGYFHKTVRLSCNKNVRPVDSLNFNSFLAP